MFIWIVKHAKGDFSAMVGAIDSWTAHVFEGVVHPSKVPFHIKAKAAVFQRMGYFWIAGRIFGNHDNALVFLMHHGIDPFDKVNGRVVEFLFFCLTPPVEEVGEGIHPDTIEVELF